METNYIITGIVLMVILFTGALSDSHTSLLEGVYPDVQSCFLEVKAKSVYLAAEWYQSKLDICRYEVKEENDLCFKTCLLEAESVLATKPFPSMDDIKQYKNKDELTYRRLYHDRLVGVNYTTLPFFPAYRAFQTYLGIVPSEKEEMEYPNIARNVKQIESKLENCKTFGFFIPKEEPSKCEEMEITNLKKLEKLKECIEKAMTCE